MINSGVDDLTLPKDACLPPFVFEEFRLSLKYSDLSSTSFRQLSTSKETRTCTGKNSQALPSLGPNFRAANIAGFDEGWWEMSDF